MDTTEHTEPLPRALVATVSVVLAVVLLFCAWVLFQGLRAWPNWLPPQGAPETCVFFENGSYTCDDGLTYQHY